MDQVESSDKNSAFETLSLSESVIFALNDLLMEFKDKKKGLRILSKKMGIHEKTLTRILNGENRPSYQTVFKIFRVFYNEFNDSKVISLVPNSVKDFLIQNIPQDLTSGQNFTSDADLELQKNPIVAEIFILAATGALQLDEIQYRFGKYGVDLVSKLIEKNILNEIHKDVFILGKNQPVFNGDTIVAVGKTMIEAHAKPKNGDELDQNFISFFAEGVSEEAYQEWLAIDQDAFQKKFNLVKDKKKLGKKRVFTFMITEQINEIQLN